MDSARSRSVSWAGFTWPSPAVAQEVYPEGGTPSESWSAVLITVLDNGRVAGQR